MSRTSRRKEVWDFWRITLPALALTNHPTVKRGLLVMSAMCLHFHDTDTIDPESNYVLAAEAHGEIFVEESRKQLERLETSEAEAHMACTKLLSTLGFAFYRNHRLKGVLLTSAAAWRWLHLLRGVLPVYEAMKSSSGEAVTPTMIQDMTPEMQNRSQDFELAEFSTATDDRNHPLFLSIMQSRTERSAALYEAVNRSTLIISDDEREDLLGAITLLETVTEHVCSGQVFSLYRALCHFPGSMPKGFVDLLTECHPLALSVYAHWLMLLIMIENLWWVGDMGRAGLQEILGICEGAGEDLSPLLEWPRRAMEFGAS